MDSWVGSGYRVGAAAVQFYKVESNFYKIDEMRSPASFDPGATGNARDTTEEHELCVG